jgi:signal transduction histidine kinase
MGLQDFNRPSSAVIVPMDIHQCIDETLLLCGKQLQIKKIGVEKDYAADMPLVKGVKDQIKQVILNLLSNAEEAIPDDGGMIEIKTEVNGPNIAIRIHDSGVGIKPEDKNQIFEPFFTTKPSVKGTGLGLSISYGIIKRHGGNIEVKSGKDKGTTGIVTMPIKGAFK